MSDYVVRSVRDEAEFDNAAELVARSMAYNSQQRYERRLTLWREHLLERPGFYASEVRVGMLNGRIVSAARISPRTLEYGRARLKIGVISEVSTHEAYRGRGYASQIIRDALTHAAELGMHMVMLLGKSGYYGRFGFVPLLPRYTLDIPAEHAATLTPVMHMQRAEATDLAQIASLYYRHWSGRITAMRTMESWQWRVQAAPDPVIVAKDDSGAVQGYIWRDQNQSSRVEVIADTADAAQSLLAFDGQRQASAGHGTLTWSVTPDDVVVLYSRLIVPVRLSAHYYPDGGWMARIIDTQSFIATILPELNAQLSGDNNTHDIVLSLEPESVEISLRSNPDVRVQTSLQDFMQLTFGSQRPAELAIRQPMSGEAELMLERIFPPRMAALAPWDWE